MPREIPVQIFAEYLRSELVSLFWWLDRSLSPESLRSELVVSHFWWLDRSLLPEPLRSELLASYSGALSGILGTKELTDVTGEGEQVPGLSPSGICIRYTNVLSLHKYPCLSPSGIRIQYTALGLCTRSLSLSLSSTSARLLHISRSRSSVEATSSACRRQPLFRHSATISDWHALLQNDE